MTLDSYFRYFPSKTSVYTFGFRITVHSLSLFDSATAIFRLNQRTIYTVSKLYKLNKFKYVVK